MNQKLTYLRENFGENIYRTLNKVVIHRFSTPYKNILIKGFNAEGLITVEVKDKVFKLMFLSEDNFNIDFKKISSFTEEDFNKYDLFLYRGEKFAKMKNPYYSYMLSFLNNYKNNLKGMEALEERFQYLAINQLSFLPKRLSLKFKEEALGNILRQIYSDVGNVKTSEHILFIENTIRSEEAFIGKYLIPAILPLVVLNNEVIEDTLNYFKKNVYKKLDRTVLADTLKDVIKKQYNFSTIKHL